MHQKRKEESVKSAKSVDSGHPDNPKRIAGQLSAEIDALAHVLSYPGIADRIPLSKSEVDVILAALLSEAEMVPGALELPGVTRDPKDDPVVACAVEGEADLIVSGDQDLLALGSHGGTQVVTPRRFLEILVE
jgi:putative PIN family toxin of toxin-antitoxin system